MERLNATGIRPDELNWVLQQVRFVRTAMREDSCLLCRSKSVNEAGLCRSCYSNLSDDDLRLANEWLAGTRP